MFQKLPYLLVGVRPVKAQEKVGGLAVQEEIGCPERDGKALDSVAEVKRDPEVLGVSIRKDVLWERKGKLRAGPARAAQHPTPRSPSSGCGAGDLRDPHAASSPSPGWEEMLVHIKQGSEKEGVQDRLSFHQVTKLVKPIFFFERTWPFSPSRKSLRHHQRAAGTQKACSSDWLHTGKPASLPPSSEQLQMCLPRETPTITPI